MSGCTFLLADMVVVVDEPGLGITVRVLPASFVNGAVAPPASLVN
jgi:hypothetical protein